MTTHAPTIREAQLHDIPPILTLWEDFMAYLSSVNPDYYTYKDGKESFGQHLKEEIEKEQNLVAIAVTDEILEGFIIAYIDALPEWFEEKPIGLIRYLAISEKAQGKGIGRELANYALEWFKSQKINRVELYVLAGLPASEFWGKMGFKSIMDRRFLEL